MADTRVSGDAAGTRALREALALPPELAAALAQDAAAAIQFEALSPSCKREYGTWIDQAKRAETRARRVAEAVARIAEGKRRG